MLFRSVDPCKYEVALDVNLAIPRQPCTTITPGEFGLEVGYQDCVTPKSEIKITPVITPGDCNNPDQCEFVIDLDLAIPIPKPTCPQIVIKSFGVTSGFAGETCLNGKQNKFSITPVITPGDCDTPDQCRFEVELEIAVPIPRQPCPVINLNKFSVDSGYADDVCLADKKNAFNLTSRRIAGSCNTPDRCEFDLELEIAIPIPRQPCPVLNSPSFSVSSGYYPEEVVVEVVNYAALPPTCDPNKIYVTRDTKRFYRCIKATGATGATGPANYIETSTCPIDENRFTITPKIVPGDCNTPDQCEYDFDLSINIPIPKPPCPIINTGVFEVQTEIGRAHV